MALYSAKTWVCISSYNLWFGFSAQLGLSLRGFYCSQLIFVIFQSSCIVFKSRESSGHSQTDIPLMSIKVFCEFRINSKNIVLHKYASFIGMLISMT